ncbi:L,D-transpeptidase [Sphingomonas sp. GCM10030256]|uniref:L,D-transpeptidase family protein n=1 Tax=Sphingomonas sp. GCM10030256 TaxID=3273427 RepID=UPI00362260E5
MLQSRFVPASLGAVLLATAAIAVAQAPKNNAATSSNTVSAEPNKAAWVPPGTPGSPIDGTVFHAQVLLDVAGFPTGVIDGKKGMVFKKAVQGFQQSRGLPESGELDAPTRAALLQQNRVSTRNLRLTEQDVSGPFLYPFPDKPEDQEKAKQLSYRNMLEKVAERFHTTPETIVALNGPDKLIGLNQVLRLPNVLPRSREHGETADAKQGELLNLFNVDAQQPRGDFVVVDKSEGVMKVYEGDVPEGNTVPPTAGKLVAQFPVTMGSKQYPLPLGRWKATTYAFMPPFHYQPDILINAKSDEEHRLPPGPNGPVGVAWLDLTKEKYGIHGTNEPQTIGRAESSGCIRLANWDVVRLSRILKPGFTAIFQA